MGVIESQFGYHIMEVLDVSKGRQNKYTLASISHKIQPSEETRNKFYREALDFATKNTTKEAFDKAVEAQKLNKRIADNLHEGEKNVPGLENPKDLVRWVYEAETGQVSTEPFSFGDRYVVAILTEVKEKGNAPLDQVKDEVSLKVKTEKKAEQFTKEFNDKLSGVKNVDELSQKMGLPAERTENLIFNSYSITGVGRDDALCGIASALKTNSLSKPFRGQMGVYVLEVESVKETPAKDYKETKKNSAINLSSRVDYEVYEAIKNLANIEDHKAKYF